MRKIKSAILKSTGLAALAAWMVVGVAGLQAQRAVQRVRLSPVPADEPYVNLSELHFEAGELGTPVFEEPMPVEAGAPMISRQVISTARSMPTAQATRPVRAAPTARTVQMPRSATPARVAPTARRTLRATSTTALAGMEPMLALGARGTNLRALGLAYDQPAMSVKSMQWEGQLVCTPPDLVIPDSGCCSYWYPDQLAGKNVVYRQPYHAFKDEDAAVAEEKAQEFAASVKASMPLFLPYKSSDVRPSSGWLYGPGRFHGAVDYSKKKYEAGEDPTFKIYSIGAGTVVSVFWDNWSGNIVIIEHRAPNGDKYRSTYMHLRNGFDHDLAEARAIPVPKDKETDKDGNPTNWLKYKRYAAKSNPSQLQWGTNAQKIAVKTGDKVRAGQFIAYAGNTGPGGAGSGLNDDGDPKNAVTANNHLHLMVTVPNPTPGSTEWVQVDPYGVYNTAGSKCYDLLDDIAYARLFAPFYSSFHNIPTAVLAEYFDYYPGMGYSLQTLSLHRRDGKVLASGSFQHGLPPQWYARFYMTGADYQHWFEEYGKKGFRPREISVTPDKSGDPRFTVIWKKRGGESYSAFHGLTDADWQARWNQLVVQGKMRVEDHVSYSDNGSTRHAAIFVKDGGGPFYEWHHMSSGDFQSKFDQYAKQGFRLVSVNAEELSGGLRWGGIWRKVPGQWISHHGLTPAQYQQKFSEYAPQGYRLHRVQGYSDSERFAAIWTRP